MPWHLELMKDATNGDTPREVVSRQRSGDLLMGQPGHRNWWPHFWWIYSLKWNNAGNWNILVPAGKENNRDSLSSGERKGKSPNRIWCGVVGPQYLKHRLVEWHWKVNHRRCKSCRRKPWSLIAVSWVRRGTWNLVGICRDHPVRLNTPKWPIVNQYCEGKVKRTADAEWNRTWNRMLTKKESTLMCDLVPFVEWTGELRYHARLSGRHGAIAKASLNRALSMMS